MSRLAVYAYRDSDRLRKFVDSDDVTFTGAWSEDTQYLASSRHVVNYLNTQYIAVQDSVGATPGNSDFWSPFVLVAPAESSAIVPKVYSALLTQHAPASNITSGTLYVGGRYTIQNNDSGDFENVGAPDNVNGTTFIATGTTPTSFGDASLSFDGAPIATITENTLDDVPAWGYIREGGYRATLAGAFPLDKTLCFLGNNTSGSWIEDGFLAIISTRSSADFVEVESGSNAAAADDCLLLTAIQILVYP